MATINEKMTAIADPIRSLTKETDPLTLDDMATDLNGCVEANADLESVLYGTDFGGKSWREMHWNAFTANNTRTLYQSAFRNAEDGCFDPPFAVKPRSAEGMFNSCKQKKITSKQLDLSECTNFPYGFASSKVEELGVIDLRKNGNNTAVFYATSELHTIEELIVADDGSTKTDAVLLFSSMPALENIGITGKFGTNVAFPHSSKLNHKSLLNILNALYDYSTTTETRTLTLHANSIDLLNSTEEGSAAIESARAKGWTVTSAA